MSNLLSGLLFKEYRRRVLGLLLLHPDQAYHVREIARLTGTVAGTLHKELSRLAKAGVLNQEKSGNQVRYSANRSCLIYDELASILRKTSGMADVLAEALLPYEKNIDSAFVFGSVASGKARVGSDIDLMVIGDVSFSDIANATYGAQETLGRHINPKVFFLNEWQERLRKKDSFVREILDKPKIMVMGDKP